MNPQRTTQPIPSGSRKIIASASVVGFALILLVANLHAATAKPDCPIAAAAENALQPILLAAASQTLQAYIFNQHLFQDLARTLLSFWLLLAVIAATVLLRALFAGMFKARRAPGKFS